MSVVGTDYPGRQPARFRPVCEALIGRGAPVTAAASPRAAGRGAALARGARWLGPLVWRAAMSSVTLAVVAVASLLVWARAADPLLAHLAAADLVGAVVVLCCRCTARLVGGDR